MTVYEFAKKCMKDAEFNRGGIVANERKYLDAIGFDYKVKNGVICESGEDLKNFYVAMHILLDLNWKYLNGGDKKT